MRLLTWISPLFSNDSIHLTTWFFNPHKNKSKKYIMFIQFFHVYLHVCVTNPFHWTHFYKVKLAVYWIMDFIQYFAPFSSDSGGKDSRPGGSRRTKTKQNHTKKKKNKWKSRILLNANYLSRARRIFPFPKEQMTLSVQRRVSTICLVCYTMDGARCLGAHSIIH